MIRNHVSELVRLVAAIGLTASLSAPLAAQTDYYNTDRGRPVQIEDAYTTERYAFELKLAPVRLQRSSGGNYDWSVEPEIAYGILPRTHLEIGLPFAYADLGVAGRRAGLAGIDVSIMHNLNAETQTLPALGLRADLLAPVGGLAPDRPYVSFTGMATRTFPGMRFHLNGQYTAGDERADAEEQSRWLVGIAADRTFPLRSLLITGEVYASQPIVSTEPVEYTAGTGVRYQWSTSVAVDAGIGRLLTGENRAWYVTFGSAYAFGMASLMPGGAR